MNRDCAHSVSPGGGGTPPTITSPTSPSAWHDPIWIARVVRRGRARRGEAVGHDGELGGGGRADRLLVAAGVRAVRHAHRVVRDAAGADAAARGEVAVAIEDDLVAVGRAVGIRAGDRVGVEVD